MTATAVTAPVTTVARPPARGGAVRRAQAAVERVTGLTWSGMALVVLVVVAWLLGRTVGGRPLYLLSYGLLAVLVASYVIGRRPLPVEGRRSESRPRLAEGETVAMSVELSAARRVSTFILEERVPDALGDAVQVPVATAESGDGVSFAYKLTCRRRGAYRLGPLVVRWGDPFGLTRREAVLVEPVELLVHPSVEQVEDRPLTRMFEDPPIRPPVSRPWPQGLEFYGMRQYNPGDDIRRIVWRAYARTGQLLVREAEQGITDRVTILLDQDAANHTAGEVSASFEAGVKAAASVGVRHLRDGFSVTLEGSEAAILPPLRTAKARIEYLDALARIERVRNAPLHVAIQRVANSVARNQHLVLITPRLDAKAAGALDQLLGRGLSVLVAALLYGEESVDTLGRASALGCQVVELRPRVPLSVAFRHQVGAGMSS
ncbi:MAG TPA: DUF58 domain-containing protein [Acidimicrobiales bacterium]|nr:DUF58 domain-containing protein [Acidimicrobiales bacterium]